MFQQPKVNKPVLNTTNSLNESSFISLLNTLKNDKTDPSGFVNSANAFL
jgi:hypothetical protein